MERRDQGKARGNPGWVPGGTHAQGDPRLGCPFMTFPMGPCMGVLDIPCHEGSQQIVAIEWYEIMLLYR